MNICGTKTTATPLKYVKAVNENQSIRRQTTYYTRSVELEWLCHRLAYASENLFWLLFCGRSHGFSLNLSLQKLP